MPKPSVRTTKCRTANVWKPGSGNRPASSDYRLLPYNREVPQETRITGENPPRSGKQEPCSFALIRKIIHCSPKYDTSVGYPTLASTVLRASTLRTKRDQYLMTPVLHKEPRKSSMRHEQNLPRM